MGVRSMPLVHGRLSDDQRRGIYTDPIPWEPNSISRSSSNPPSPIIWQVCHFSFEHHPDLPLPFSMDNELAFEDPGESSESSADERSTSTTQKNAGQAPTTVTTSQTGQYYSATTTSTTPEILGKGKACLQCRSHKRVSCFESGGLKRRFVFAHRRHAAL